MNPSTHAYPLYVGLGGSALGGSANEVLKENEASGFNYLVALGSRWKDVLIKE